MTGHEMLDEIKQWTKVSDEAKRLVALRKAYNWAIKRVYNSENGPNLLASIGEELSALGATTKTLDIGSLLSHPFLGFKKLWVKLPADTKFTAMVPADTADEDFGNADSDPAASLQVAQGHPVMYDIINYASARFAPALPAGAVIRVDYYRLAHLPGDTDSGESESSELNEEPILGKDLPAIFDDSIVNKAISILFGMLDDDREGAWEMRAKDEINDALFVPKNPGPTRVKGFKTRRRRFI